MNQSRIGLVVLFSILLGVGTASEAFGQAQVQIPKMRYDKPGTPKKVIANPSVFSAVAQAPPSLPYMPQITPPNSKYILGMNNNGKNQDGSSRKTINLSLRYATNESGPAILKFYADSLKQAGWTVLTANSRITQAAYKGNACTVLLVPPTANNVTDFQVNYDLVNTDK